MTGELVEEQCNKFREFMHKEGIADYIDLRCRGHDESDEPLCDQESGMSNEDAGGRRIDLFVEDTTGITMKLIDKAPLQLSQKPWKPCPITQTLCLAQFGALARSLRCVNRSTITALTH